MKITVKKIKIDSSVEKYLVLIGVIFFILSNTYFGWNRESQSGAEDVCDIIWHVLVFGGAFWWFVNRIVEEALNNIKDITLENND